MAKILKFSNIVSIILLLINWMAIHDLSNKAANLNNEWSFMTIINLIILLVLIANIIFLGYCGKQKPDQEV